MELETSAYKKVPKEKKYYFDNNRKYEILYS